MSEHVQRARAALSQWAHTPVRQRTAALKRLRLVITARMDEIVSTISAEIGKPPMDALSGDVMVVLETLRFLEKHARAALQPRKVNKPLVIFQGANFTEYRRPHGVALVIAPWNYPFQLAMVPAVTALVCGNAVILKCSEQAPATASLIASLFREAGIPETLVQVNAASPAESEAMIAARPDIIFFTGSSRNGTQVAQQAASLLIPVVLELGGKDACIVFRSAAQERTVRGVCYGAFSNAGQVCVGLKRIYVERPSFAEFLQGLVREAMQLRVGSSIDSDIGTLHSADLSRLLADQVEDAIARGATLHTPWSREANNLPIILSNVPHDSRLLTEETFGPVVCVEPFSTEAEAIALANSSEFALGASVFSGDAAQARRVSTALDAGTVCINDAIRAVGNPYAAFGGNHRSGYGRYHGIAGLHVFTRSTTIMETGQSRQREMHWFPFTAGTFRALRSIMILRHGTLGSIRQAFRNSSL